MRRLLRAPALLKHRLLIGCSYGCGLRCMEVRSIHIKDLDLDRRLCTCVKAKGGRTGMCPWASCLCRGVRSYLEAENPRRSCSTASPRAARAVILTVATPNAGCSGPYSRQPNRPASKRHLGAHPAPHLCHPIAGRRTDIVSIKELLGHERIETTMVYLHVAKHGRKAPFSPLDTLFAPAPEAGPRSSAGHRANMGTG